jgi:uncharacterized membrane protein YjfL (UPF0719 family)
MVVYGCLLILRPGIFKKIIAYIAEGNRVYVAAGIKVIAGAVLMIGSSQCRVSWFVLLLGALTVLFSIVFFFLKRKIVNDLVEKLKNLRRKRIFFIGITALVVGILLILSI